MMDLVHRHAPVETRPRAALALLTGVVGLPLLLWGLVGLTVVPGDPAVFGLLAVGAPLTIVAAQLARGILGEARAAPREANPVLQSHRAVEESPIEGGDPVETLQARYARGEVTDEEFDRRMERLLESGTDRVADDGETTVEEALEH